MQQQKRSSSWRAHLLIGGAISVVLASVATAQVVPPGCVLTSNPNSTAAGALLDGVAGALLGSAVAGRHDRGAGAVLGGLGGAVAGGAIGNSRSQGVACPQGYVYRAPPPVYYVPPPPPPVVYGDVWYGAPVGLHERIDFLHSEIARVDQDGWLSPRELGGLYNRLDEIEQEADQLRYQTGGYLLAPDRARLFGELNDVAHRIHWDEYVNSHPHGY